jgi:hypothetical protein
LEYSSPKKKAGCSSLTLRVTLAGRSIVVIQRSQQKVPAKSGDLGTSLKHSGFWYSFDVIGSNLVVRPAHLERSPWKELELLPTQQK